MKSLKSEGAFLLSDTDKIHASCLLNSTSISIFDNRQGNSHWEFVLLLKKTRTQRETKVGFTRSQASIYLTFFCAVHNELLH